MTFTSQAIIRACVSVALFCDAHVVMGQGFHQAIQETIHLPQMDESVLDLETLVATLRKIPQENRSEWIFEALQAGYFPDFLRQLQAVSTSSRQHQLTFWVMPDYLALGEDSDFLHVNLSQQDALSLAASWGMLLPTRLMVDIIYKNARMNYPAEPLMRTPGDDAFQLWLSHEELIDRELQEFAVSSQLLQAGHKKDIVLIRQGSSRTARAAIYGWQGTHGQALQGLSHAIRPNYTDYSMGLRLLAPWCLLDGRWIKIADVLRDPQLASLLSDEGSFDIDSLLRLDESVAPRVPLIPSNRLVQHLHP